ncbi:MAG: hypothetical protein GWP07_01495 [Xanthomonadaceae bacterium]|nr:hypothetical protein [Xanthomonadaceae bacterium]
MKVYCEYCQARCRIDESKIPAAGGFVRCPACQKIFFLNPEEARVKEEAQIPEATLLPDVSETEPQEEKPPASEVITDKPTVPAATKPATKSTTSKLQRFITSRPLAISIAITILIEVLLLVLWGTGQQPVIQSKSSSLSIPIVSIQIKNQAIKKIATHSLVGDAAINQQGNELSLALLVDQSTPPSYALKLGRKFVETLKKLTDYPSYQFHLFIYYPNGKEVTDQLSNAGDIRDN